LLLVLVSRCPSGRHRCRAQAWQSSFAWTWTPSPDPPRVWAGDEHHPGALRRLNLGSPSSSRYGLWPRRPPWPSPGDADSDFTAGST
jgi:hypothetical protein